MQYVYTEDAAGLAYLNTFLLSVVVWSNGVANGVAVPDLAARSNPA